MPRSLRVSAVLAVLLSAFTLHAQRTASRITGPIDASQQVTLPGNVHPLATAANDRGLLPDSTPLPRIQLILKHSDAQEVALRQLIEDLHNPTSASFHQWLTPEQFGAQFGPSDEDLATVTGWLAAQGFTVTKVNPGRQTLEFSATAGQFRNAFHTEIHTYATPATGTLKASLHTANNAVPQIPAALAPVIGGFVSLNNFTPKAPAKILGNATYNPSTNVTTKADWTIGSSSTGYTFALAPADFAVQYDITPLYSAGTKGNGQSIAVINLSNVNAYFFNQYRSLFGLPASTLNVVIDGNDPGVNGINNPDGPNGWATEAYLDVEMTSMAAPAATIDLVIAGDTALSSGAILAAQHAVYNNVAPIISYSISQCEKSLSTSNAFLSSLWQQAAAQGITVVVSSSDSGSAGCDDFDTQSYATQGQAVNGWSSTPYNVSVGGTDFYYSSYAVGGSTLGNQIASYWNEVASNNTPVVSLKSYIPEQPWNDTQYGLNAAVYSNGSNAAYYTNYGTNIVGGSGGPSNCGVYVTSCAPYPKPSWQTGSGVPADGARDIPDVSLFAANGYNYTYYPICASDGDCQPVSAGNTVQISGAGGTSASAPAFAGIMALVNQKYGRQGQANFVLYPLATQYPAAFHDVTVGNNTVPCNIAITPSNEKPTNCIAVSNPITVVDQNTGTGSVVEGEVGSGTTLDYKAGTGYDLASGLGTLDVNLLITNWNKVTFAGTTTTLRPSSTSFTHGTAVTISGSVTNSLAAVPTGSVAVLTTSTLPNAASIAPLALSGGSFSSSVNYLPGGTYNIYGRYSGDAANAASSSTPVSITVTPETSATALEVVGETPTNTAVVNNGASLSYGTTVDLEGLSAPTAVLTTYVQCFLYGTVTCPIFTSPTGTTILTDNSAALRTVPLNANGEADFGYVPALGSHAVAATYSGDASYTGSASATTSFLVGKDTPALSATENNYGQNGGAIALNFLVTNSVDTSGKAVAPTGTLTLSGGPATLPATAALVAGVNPSTGASAGIATVLLPSNTPAGTYTITYAYPGDSNYSATQSTFNITITAGSASKLASTINASVSAPYSTPGAAAIPILTATVTGLAGHPSPTSYVLLYVNGSLLTDTTLPTSTSTSVSVTFPIPSQALLQGVNAVTVEYYGDTNYLPSATTLTITNANADFALTPAATVLAATSTTVTDALVLSSINGFSGSVTLGCATSTITCSLSSSSVALAAGGTGTSTLTLNTSAAVAGTSYPVVITATDATGQFVHTATITVTAPATISVPTPSFTVTPASSSLTASNNTATDLLTLSSVNGFTGPVTIACSTSTITCSFSSSSVTLTSGGTGTSTLTINTTGVAAGTYALGLNATSGTVTVPLSLTVIVPSTLAPGFTLANGGNITIATQGASGQTGLTLTPTNGFTGVVNLACAVTSSPTGASYTPTCSVTSPITITGTTAGTGTLTINTTAQAQLARPFGWLNATGSAALAVAFAWLLLPKRRRRLAALMLLCAACLTLGTLSGCGSNSSSGGTTHTPTGGTTLGTYTVTVTATSGTIVATTAVTVTVN
jgi:hypothetical protein